MDATELQTLICQHLKLMFILNLTLVIIAFFTNVAMIIHFTRTDRSNDRREALLREILAELNKRP